jgi:hypothetical protein
MSEPIGLELLAHELDLRSPLWPDAATPRSHPRLAHERTHLLEPVILEVAGEELFVRTLDQQTRGLRRAIT